MNGQAFSQSSICPLDVTIVAVLDSLCASSSASSGRYFPLIRNVDTDVYLW